LKLKKKNRMKKKKKKKYLIKNLNNRLMKTERKFLNRVGLPKRPYLLHVIQAPAFYTGYSYQVFPGLSQAIMDQNWTQAQTQLNILTFHIYEAAQFLENGELELKLFFE